MALFGRDKATVAIESAVIRGFYSAANAAAESYEVAANRVEEGDLSRLFSKLRTRHFDFADDFKKRAKKLGSDPEDRTGVANSLAEAGGRTLTRINAAGSVRDLLIAMRMGEENGVAMAREALEDVDLSGKSKSLIESYMQAHIDAIRDLSEQVALRGDYLETSAEFYAPQWLRYPRAGFWVLEGALIVLGYLFGRSGSGNSSSSGSSSGSTQSGQQGHRTSPRAKLGGDQSVEQYGEQIAREVGH